MNASRFASLNIVAPAMAMFALSLPGARSAAATIVAGENLVANGDFRSRDPEQRPLRWITGKGLQTATLTPKEHHGAQKDDCGLAVTDASPTDRVAVRSEKRIAVPGCIYLARAWARNGSGAPAALYLEFWDQNAARIGVASAAPKPGSEWQEVKVSLAAPDTVTHVSVSIASAAATEGVSYWDDVSLVSTISYEPGVAAGVRELFLDDYRVESIVDVQRVVHPGRKSGPLISATEPWEGNAVYIYGTVLKDQPQGTGYRMWYTAYSGEYYLCHATSTDGLVWHKPELGLVEFKGSKANNITRVGGGTLVFDPNDADAGRRFKLMTYHTKGPGKPGYSVFFAPDGLQWTAYPGNPVLPYGDVCAVAYDRDARIFIATTKQRMLVANTSVTPGKQDRSAFVSVSRNFTEWTAPGAPQSAWALAVEGDPSDDLAARAGGGIEAQIYGMPVYPYEKVYIGMPWVFCIKSYTAGIYAGTGDGPIQPQLAVSRDLRHWSRPVREPVLPLGQAGAWDDGTLYTASSLLISGEEMELYFGAMNLGHGGSTATQTQVARIAKATWRRDGFVSFHNAGDDVGVITTKPMTFQHASQLKLNAVLRTGGALRVGIIDAAGAPLPGYAPEQAAPITGDQPAAVVAWSPGADMRALAGRSIRLRFEIKGGDLYSFWFE